MKVNIIKNNIIEDILKFSINVKILKIKINNNRLAKNKIDAMKENAFALVKFIVHIECSYLILKLK